MPANRRPFFSAGVRSSVVPSTAPSYLPRWGSTSLSVTKVPMAVTRKVEINMKYQLQTGVTM